MKKFSRIFAPDPTGISNTTFYWMNTIENLRFSLTRENLYWRVAKRLLWVMALFSLGRFLFFLYNRSFFPEVTWWQYGSMALGGLKFDTTAVLYTNLLYLVLILIPFQFRYRPGYQQLLKGIFFITNALALIGNCADIVYFQFIKRRTTATVFKEFSDETGRLGDFLSTFFLDYWYILLLWFGLMGLLYWAYGKPVRKPEKFVTTWLYYPGGLVLMALLSGLIVAGLRGGFGESVRPITLQNAGEYADKPLELAIVLNTPFSVYKTLETNGLPEESYFKTAPELEGIYQPVHRPVAQPPFQPRNVVILIIESLSQEFIGALNHDLDGGRYRGYTPFLDSLVGVSRTFQWSFANGERSIDALPSVTTSIPNVQDPFFTSLYSGNTVHSLAWHLRRKGYQTAFFHGAPNGSMGFWPFLNLAGYQQYFGKDEYGNNRDYDGIWGIWDEPFLQFMARKLTTMPQPFHAMAFTLTSHHPFQIPKEFEGKFPVGPTPFHRCMGYTDYALRQFFRTASRQPWFRNTLFVITGDHTNGQAHAEYKTDVGFFRVPVIFYEPGVNNPEDPALRGHDETRLIQQMDVMPTLLNYLHYDESYFAFGKDAFASGDNWAFNYINQTYQYFLDDYVIQYRDPTVLSLYNFREDKLLKNNLAGKMPEVQNRLLAHLKAFMQQYHNRMIHDQLTVPPVPVGPPAEPVPKPALRATR